MLSEVSDAQVQLFCDVFDMEGSGGVDADHVSMVIAELKVAAETLNLHDGHEAAPQLKSMAQVRVRRRTPGSVLVEFPCFESIRRVRRWMRRSVGMPVLARSSNLSRHPRWLSINAPIQSDIRSAPGSVLMYFSRFEERRRTG